VGLYGVPAGGAPEKGALSGPSLDGEASVEAARPSLVVADGEPHHRA